jgi:ribosomal protein L37E
VIDIYCRICGVTEVCVIDIYCRICGVPDFLCDWYIL